MTPPKLQRRALAPATSAALFCHFASVAVAVRSDTEVGDTHKNADNSGDSTWGTSAQASGSSFSCPPECRACCTVKSIFTFNSAKFKCMLFNQLDLPKGRTCTEPERSKNGNTHLKTHCNYIGEEAKGEPWKQLHFNDACSRKLFTEINRCCCAEKDFLCSKERPVVEGKSYAVFQGERQVPICVEAKHGRCTKTDIQKRSRCLPEDEGKAPPRLDLAPNPDPDKPFPLLWGPAPQEGRRYHLCPIGWRSNEQVNAGDDPFHLGPLTPSCICPDVES